MNSIKGDRAVDLVVSLNDLKKLQKNDSLETLNWFRSVDQSKTVNEASSRKELLMTCLLRRIALIKKSGSLTMDMIGTSRIIFLDKPVPVETFEKKPESTCVFPNAYIRTLNAKPLQTASLLERHF
jgi:hypothetical protein